MKPEREKKNVQAARAAAATAAAVAAPTTHHAASVCGAEEPQSHRARRHGVKARRLQVVHRRARALSITFRVWRQRLTCLTTTAAATTLRRLRRHTVVVVMRSE
jgi:hypothetical protein